MSSSKQGRAARASAGFRIRPLLGALAAAGIIAPTSLHAATIPVTTGGDAGNAGTCTLRQAVETLNTQALAGACANSSMDGFGTNDRVDLTGQTGTITLAGTEIPVTRSILVDGPGAAQLRISGGSASRVLSVSSAYSVSLDIARVTIASGRSAGPGGCIYSPGGVVSLDEAVVTGCQALHDPMSTLPFLNGLGGGILAQGVFLAESTVSGNTAQTAGGGIFAARYLAAYRSAITGNTVLGQSCTVDPEASGLEQKYCTTAAFGGGGALVGGTTFLDESTVSGNTVVASTLGDGTDSYRLGWGGGIASFSKYSPPEDLAAAGKSTIQGVRALFPRATPAAQARMRAAFTQHAKAAAQRSGRPRAKADGYGDERFGMFASTLSGNRVLAGAGPAPTIGAKYAGGGAAFFSQSENAEVANSTVSGNTLPAGTCTYAAQPPFALACGAGLSGDSFELTNSTVTGNVGWSAVQQVKYDSGPPSVLASKAKAAKALARYPKLNALHARWSASPAGQAAKRAVAKASSPPIMDSTIVAGNVGTYDVGCLEDCSIAGANNLVRTRQSTVSFVNAPISANPQLAPLANNGGVFAGAPGVVGSGTVLTHALYIGSPAIDGGSNIEGFSYDQRGSGFPRQSGGGVDIGAFEGAIPNPGPAAPVPGLGPAGLALLGSMVAFAAAYLRRRRTV